MIYRGFGKYVDKAVLLTSLFWKRPLEFFDRVLTFLEVRLGTFLYKAPVYEAMDLADAVKLLAKNELGGIQAFITEPHCDTVEQEVRTRMDKIRERAPFH